jgi:hypothetical protein
MLEVRSDTQSTFVLSVSTEVGNTVTCYIVVYSSQFIIPALPNKFAQAVMLLLCVPEVSGSNLSLQKFSSLSHSVQATADVMPYTESRMSLFSFFPPLLPSASYPCPSHVSS